MSASLAILTIGIVPMQEVLPLLTEYIDEDNISHHSLLGKLSREEVMAEYAPEAGEDTILTLLNDNHLAHVSRRKVERDLQGVVEVLDNQGYDVIILMSTANISSMTARNTIFLEPSRILPPLVSSIVEDHQVGVIVPVEELLNRQYFHWVTPFMIRNKKSLMPGKNYWQKVQMSSCWIVWDLTSVIAIYCKNSSMFLSCSLTY